MTRRVFYSSFFLGALVLFLCAALFFTLQVNQTLEETYEALQGEAKYAARGLQLGGISYLAGLEGINRVTWIAEDGMVLYDSVFRDLTVNQAGYPEVEKALSEGEGQGIRRSDSGGVETMYYAFRCDDGSVLRLSRPMQVVRDALHAVTPVLWILLLVLAFSAVMAFHSARVLLQPVNNLNLDDPDPEKSYPELAPLLHRIREQQNTIRAEAAERESLRKEFSANVSHELKTPLTSISGFAELMRDGLVPADMTREFAGDIYRESQRLIALIDDIIRLSRLDEENGFPEPEPVELHALSEEILAALRPLAAEGRITLELLGEPILVKGIRQVIHEMIYNLVDNAIKYNREGGSVTVSIAALDGEPTVAVTDTGIGIPKEEQERIFERFYRVDKSHSKAIGGTGLGLSIVKHGAMLHDAVLSLDSTPGRGTTVRIRFPRSGAEEADAASLSG